MYSGEIRIRQKKLFNKLIQQLFKLLKTYTGDIGINRAYMVLTFIEFMLK